MEAKNITIRVNAKVARIFETASEEQRRKLEALLSLKLSDATRHKSSNSHFGKKSKLVFLSR